MAGLYAAALLLGVWLRLDQFLVQVLIDDEWHAVHQLILRTPKEILLSFGHADYSIPLTLFYWWVAQQFGLSELAMRLPMMVCGLGILMLFPLYVLRRCGLREATVFAFLLAISPLLVIYSRIARPYSITLLMGFVAHFAFHGYRERPERRLLHGTVYALSAILATWLHTIAGPFVVAPFILAGWASLRRWREDRGQSLLQLLYLGLPTAAGMLLVLLPPLLSDLGALTGKAGIHSPSWQTLRGVWYAWFGTPLSAAVLASLVLAGFGASRMWRELPVARSALAGVILTVVPVLLARPAWIHHPLTFGRYLLPMVPLLLLAAALGAVRLADWAARNKGFLRFVPAPVLLFLPVAALALRSPVLPMLQRPNTNTLHSVFQFDFRPQRSPIEARLDTIPLSSYWASLAQQPRGSLRMAAAPWYFESYDWDAPRWERISGQTVLPGYLTGLCRDWRAGEVPIDRRFRFRNAVHLSDFRELAAKRIDRVVFQKPYQQRNDAVIYTLGADTADCEGPLRSLFGKPLYEDAIIIVFSAAAADDQR